MKYIILMSNGEYTHSFELCSSYEEAETYVSKHRFLWQCMLIRELTKETFI